MFWRGNFAGARAASLDVARRISAHVGREDDCGPAQGDLAAGGIQPARQETQRAHFTARSWRRSIRNRSASSSCIGPASRTSVPIGASILGQAHVGQQVTVVRLADAHHLLHRGGGEADLVADDRRGPAPDVAELDRVRIGRLQPWIGLGQRRDGRAVTLSRAQAISDRGQFLLREHPHAVSPARLRGALRRRLPSSLVPRSSVQAAPRPSGSLRLRSCVQATPRPCVSLAQRTALIWHARGR